MKVAVGLPLTLALVYRAWSRRSLTPFGIVVAAVTAVIHTWHPWSVFFACLVVFFLGGTAVTKVKHDVKARLTLSSTGSSGGEGPRSHVQVLANSAVASLLVGLHAWLLKQDPRGSYGEKSCWSWGGDVLVVGIIANYAAVAADTFSSELGILSSSRPRLITSATFREVPPGTNGGVTIVGLLAGLLGSFTIALTSVILLPFCQGTSSGLKGLGSGVTGLQQKIIWVVFVTIWGALGSLLDSLLGGLLQASVIDVRTGKVVEGEGGRKVPIGPSGPVRSRLHLQNPDYVRAPGDGQATDRLGSRQRHVESTPATPHSYGSGRASREVESGLGILDNNAVNFLMALIMSISGMAVAAWYWNSPFGSVRT